MNERIALGVWGYMVLAVLSEVFTFYNLHATAGSYPLMVTVVLILAASQAVAIVLFYMQLTSEPGSIKLFALIPIMFLSALIIAMLASLG